MKVGIINFYNKLLSEYKDSPLALGWGSKKSQELRFKTLCGIGDLKNKTILDWGCGLGDFYKFLTKYEIKEYVGYDISFDMVSAAMKKYPDAIFRNYIEINHFDYILASGIFNLKAKNWEKETHRTLRKMWGMCKRGMAINFLSSFSSHKDKKCYYADPIEILKFVSTLTTKFCLIHNYKENDFTIYLYK